MLVFSTLTNHSFSQSSTDIEYGLHHKKAYLVTLIVDAYQPCGAWRAARLARSGSDRADRGFFSKKS
jgi:hypothetical protein